MVRTSGASRREDDRGLEARLFDIGIGAGAIQRCGNGHPCLYRAFDNRAEARAFSEAAAAYSNGAFPDHRLEAVIGLMGAILDGVSDRCAECGAAAS